MPINSTSSAVSHQTRKQIRSKSRGLIFWVLHFQQKCVLEHRNWAANTFPRQKYIYELKKPFTRQQAITVSGKTLTSKNRERRNHNSSREVLEGWGKVREKEKKNEESLVLQVFEVSFDTCQNSRRIFYFTWGTLSWCPILKLMVGFSIFGRVVCS